MEGGGSVVSLVDRVVLDVGLHDSANHVVMDGVAAQFEGLADVEELTVLNATNDRLIAGRVHHDVGSILVGR